MVLTCIRDSSGIRGPYCCSYLVVRRVLGKEGVRLNDFSCIAIIQCLVNEVKFLLRQVRVELMCVLDLLKIRCCLAHVDSTGQGALLLRCGRTS